MRIHRQSTILEMRRVMSLDPNIQILGEDHNMILKTNTKMKTSWNTKRLFQKGRMMNIHQKQNKMKFACRPCKWFITLPSIGLWRETLMFHYRRNAPKRSSHKRNNLTRSCLKGGI